MGFEAFVYLSHITRSLQRDDVADFTAFMQGNPFDHIADRSHFVAQ